MNRKHLKMDAWIKKAQEIEIQNMAKAIKEGPKLRLNPTSVLGIDPWSEQIFKGGLGAMGVGRMWTLSQGSDEEDLRIAIEGGVPICGAKGFRGTELMPEVKDPGIIQNLLDELRPGWRDQDYCPMCRRKVEDPVQVDGLLIHYECF